MDPFEQLTRSHRRLVERMEELRRAASEPSPHSAGVVADVAAFFERAVKRHEDDEELSLFPRLAANAALAPILTKLTVEHRAQEALKSRLATIAADLESGVPFAEVARAVEALATELRTAYDAHIDEEENRLFPAARAALDASALDAISAEMDSRRGRR